jgi:hypothetical protein
MTRRATGAAVTAVVLFAAAGLSGIPPVHAVPPPPPLPETVIDLRAGGPERVVNDEVRAYQAVPISFEATAADELLLWLTDAEGLLVIDLEGPSGPRWLAGARPGPDGLRIRLTETGVHRVHVVMTGDASRRGRAARFLLRLKLLR